MNTNYYIMVNPDSPDRCKIGISKNPEQRLRAYKTANPACYMLSVYKNIDKKHEKSILNMIKDVFPVRSEYVHCNPKLVQNMIEGYFTDNEIIF